MLRKKSEMKKNRQAVNVNQIFTPERNMCVADESLFSGWLCTPGFVSHSTQTGGPDYSNYAATAMEPSDEDDVEYVWLQVTSLKT